MSAHARAVASSHALLSHHARSFRWAAAFLPVATRDDAAVLYAFCRAVDDAVDEADEKSAALAALRQLEDGLRRPVSALMCALAEMVAQNGIALHAAEELIAGVRSDLDTVRVRDDRELLRYCYRAAGTVGAMMCGVLGVDDPRAWAHAVDLGIAMQLTNICRDVAEDAAMGRVYLPAQRLAEHGVTQAQLVDGHADPAAVARVVRDLLALADAYYRSADEGMRYIPARPRLAIYVAARIYRAIGVVLRRRGGDALAGRTVVPWWQKAGWVTVAVAAWLASLFGPTAALHRHRGRLHAHLEGLARPS